MTAIKKDRNNMYSKNLIIYGAGNVGIKALDFFEEFGYTVIFFIDSDKNKCGMRVRDKMIVSFEQFLKSPIREKIVICLNERNTIEIEKKLYAANISNYTRFEELRRAVIYDSIKPGKEKLAIWGWWQGKNLGDNWIMQTNKMLFPNAVFIDTMFQDINDFGFVLIGGGGLFINSVIPPWNGGVKVPFGGWGLGAEFAHSSNDILKLSERAEFFYARDKKSYELMGISNRECSYDVTFAIPLDWGMEERNMEKVLFIWYEEDISSSELYNDYTCNKNFYFDCLQILYQKYSKVEISNFQTSNYEVQNIITDCSLIVSGKYHGIVAAIQSGIPCIAVEMSTKLRDIMNDCDLGEFCITTQELEKLPDLIDKVRKEYNMIRQKQYIYRNRANQRMIQCYKEIKEKIQEYVDVS